MDGTTTWPHGPHGSQRSSRGALRGLFAVLVAIIATLPARTVHAVQQTEITGDRLSGFVLPIEPLAADMEISSLRAWAWQVDDTKRLVLEGDVRLIIGRSQFAADTAVVWLNRIPSAGGVINQFAAYFPKVSEPTKRAGLGVFGENLLVTGSTRGRVVLNAVMQDGRPDERQLLRTAEGRLADYLKRTLLPTQGLSRLPQVDALPQEPEMPLPVVGGPTRLPEPDLPEYIAPPPREGEAPLFRPKGAIRFTAGRTIISGGDVERTILATNGVALEYYSGSSGDELTHITLHAERAVIFASGGSVTGLSGGQSSLSTDDILGVYLEGNVLVSANDGSYAVTAPRVYYDMRSGQAIMLNAILRTYAQDGRPPIYARAESMRQIAENQWTGRHVRVSTSEFHEPHLAIGADKMTVTRRPSEGGEAARVYLDSRGNTMRVNGLPIVYWPRLAGEVGDLPLRNLSLEFDESNGFSVESTWDFFTLTGLKHVDELDVALKLDGYAKRGPGVGLVSAYAWNDMRGELDVYGLYDQGEDLTSSGGRVNFNNDFRGIATWEHQMELSSTWSLTTQAAYISDPSYVSTWRDADFRERREYETSAYALRQTNRTQFGALVQFDVNDFISNSYLLASRGYTVDRVPEFSFRRAGISFFNDRITWTSETSAARLRFSLDEDRPDDHGVRGRAFGIPDDVPLSTALMARGVPTDYITRIDTRHEFAMPLSWGAFNLTPFGVLRLTAYSEDFDRFAGQDIEKNRFFGSMGVRFHTTIQRVYDNVESRFFNVHRLRHIIEPYATAWYGYTSIKDGMLPVYDETVESIGGGAVLDIGVRNVLQTQRGGPGRWRTVDLVTFDTAIHFSEDNFVRESPTPQFFGFRPEYSQFGDHVRSEAQWLLSDTMAVLGTATYDFDKGVIARGSIGAEIRHSPAFTTHVEYRYIEIDDNELFGTSFQYQLTPKYEVRLSPQFDLKRNEFRAARFRITRAFPDFELLFEVAYDDIRGETVIGASLGRAEF